MSESKHTLRRPVSLLLAFALVLGLILPCVPMVHAADPVITAVSFPNTVEMMEILDRGELYHTDGSRYQGYDPLSMTQDGPEVEVAYSDGSTENTTLYELCGRYMMGFTSVHDQYTTPWVGGGVYQMDVVLKADVQVIGDLNELITGDLPVTMTLPAAAKGHGHYKVARSHNGVTELLDATVDQSAGTIRFNTDRFSTYALVWVEEENTGSGSTVTGIAQTAAAPAQSPAPLTGDGAQPALYAALCLIALCGLAAVSRRRSF